MKNNNLSDSNARFARAFEATLKYTSLPKEQVSCSKGSLKRWADVLQVLTAYAQRNKKISPVRWALDSFHWAFDHTDSLEAAEAELVSALLDELHNGTDAIKSWRRNSAFTEPLTETINSVCPLGKTRRWIYSGCFFRYLRNRTLDSLFHKEADLQCIDLSLASNYEIRYKTRVARTRQDWQAFEASISRLLPEVESWPKHKRRNESAVLRTLKSRYGVDYVRHQRDFDAIMFFLNARCSKGASRLHSFLSIQVFSEELARGIWPENAQAELERLFIRAHTLISTYKNRSEKTSYFTGHYNYFSKQLRGSWLFNYVSTLHASNMLTDKNQLKVSKALMELSMGLL